MPLSKRKIENYLRVIGGLDFVQACTPFKHTANTTTADAVRLILREKERDKENKSNAKS